MSAMWTASHSIAKVLNETLLSAVIPDEQKEAEEEAAAAAALSELRHRKVSEELERRRKLTEEAEAAAKAAAKAKKGAPPPPPTEPVPTDPVDPKALVPDPPLTDLQMQRAAVLEEAQGNKLLLTGQSHEHPPLDAEEIVRNASAAIVEMYTSKAMPRPFVANPSFLRLTASRVSNIASSNIGAMIAATQDQDASPPFSATRVLHLKKTLEASITSKIDLQSPKSAGGVAAGLDQRLPPPPHAQPDMQQHAFRESQDANSLKVRRTASAGGGRNSAALLDDKPPIQKMTLEERKHLERIETTLNFLPNPRIPKPRTTLKGGPVAKISEDAAPPGGANSSGVLNAGRMAGLKSADKGASGSALTSVVSFYPTEIEFQDVDPGQQYSCSLTIRNTSDTAHRIQVLPPKPRKVPKRPFPVFILRGRFPDSSGLVAPGMSCSFLVGFAPSTFEECHMPPRTSAGASSVDVQDDCYVTVATESAKSQVPVRAFRNVASVEFSSPQVEFPTAVLVGSSQSVSLKLRNPSQRRSVFVALHLDGAAVTTSSSSSSSSSGCSSSSGSGRDDSGNSPFSLVLLTAVSPSPSSPPERQKIELPAGAETEVEVVFAPVFLGGFHAQLTCVVSEMQGSALAADGALGDAPPDVVLSVPVSARSCRAALSVVRRPGDRGPRLRPGLGRLFFEPVTFGSSASEVLCINNDCDADVCYRWVLLPQHAASHPLFSVYPPWGVIPARGSREFTVRFAPDEGHRSAAPPTNIPTGLPDVWRSRALFLVEDSPEPTSDDHPMFEAHQRILSNLHQASDFEGTRGVGVSLDPLELFRESTTLHTAAQAVRSVRTSPFFQIHGKSMFPDSSASDHPLWPGFCFDLTGPATAVPVVVEPSVVVFAGSLSVGKPFDRYVTLVNRGEVAVDFDWDDSSSSGRQGGGDAGAADQSALSHLIVYPSVGSVEAGASVRCKVTAVPLVRGKQLQLHLVCRVSGGLGCLHVPVLLCNTLAGTGTSMLTIDEPLINVGSAEVGSTVTAPMVIRNRFSAPVPFRLLYHPDAETADGAEPEPVAVRHAEEVVFAPSFGELKPRGSVMVSVFFRPQSAVHRRLRGVIECVSNVGVETSVYARLSGDVEVRDVRVKYRLISFGGEVGCIDVPMSQMTTIRNFSGLSCSYSWRVENAEDESCVLIVTPPHGVLAPYAEAEVDVTMVARRPGNHRLMFALVVMDASAPPTQQLQQQRATELVIPCEAMATVRDMEIAVSVGEARTRSVILQRIADHADGSHLRPEEDEKDNDKEGRPRKPSVSLRLDLGLVCVRYVNDVRTAVAGPAQRTLSLMVRNLSRTRTRYLLALEKHGETPRRWMHGSGGGGEPAAGGLPQHHPQLSSHGHGHLGATGGLGAAAAAASAMAVAATTATAVTNTRTTTPVLPPPSRKDTVAATGVSWVGMHDAADARASAQPKSRMSLLSAAAPPQQTTSRLQRNTLGRVPAADVGTSNKFSVLLSSSGGRLEPYAAARIDLCAVAGPACDHCGLYEDTLTVHVPGFDTLRIPVTAWVVGCPIVLVSQNRRLASEGQALKLKLRSRLSIPCKVSLALVEAARFQPLACVLVPSSGEPQDGQEGGECIRVMLRQRPFEDREQLQQRHGFSILSVEGFDGPLDAVPFGSGEQKTVTISFDPRSIVAAEDAAQSRASTVQRRGGRQWHLGTSHLRTATLMATVVDAYGREHSPLEETLQAVPAEMSLTVDRSIPLQVECGMVAATNAAVAALVRRRIVTVSNPLAAPACFRLSVEPQEAFIVDVDVHARTRCLLKKDAAVSDVLRDVYVLHPGESMPFGLAMHSRPLDSGGDGGGAADTVSGNVLFTLFESHGLLSSFATRASSLTELRVQRIPVAGVLQRPKVSVFPSVLDFGTVERAESSGAITVFNDGISDVRWRLEEVADSGAADADRVFEVSMTEGFLAAGSGRAADKPPSAKIGVVFRPSGHGFFEKRFRLLVEEGTVSPGGPLEVVLKGNAVFHEFSLAKKIVH